MSALSKNFTQHLSLTYLTKFLSYMGVILSKKHFIELPKSIHFLHRSSLLGVILSKDNYITPKVQYLFFTQK